VVESTEYGRVNMKKEPQENTQFTLKDGVHFYKELYDFVDNELYEFDGNKKIYYIYYSGVIDDTVSFVNRFVDEIIKNGSNKNLKMDDVKNMIWICFTKLVFDEETFFSNLQYFCFFKDGRIGIRVFNRVFNHMSLTLLDIYTIKRKFGEKKLYEIVFKLLVDWCEIDELKIIERSKLYREFLKSGLDIDTYTKYRDEVIEELKKLSLKRLERLSRNDEKGNDDIMTYVIYANEFILIYQPFLDKIISLIKQEEGLE